jgi:tetratricopeptide (TPR) repeat protein
MPMTAFATAESIERDKPFREPGEFTGRLAEVALGYQKILVANPCDVAALVGMSLVALASRQTGPAIQMAEAAVAVQSADRHLHRSALVALGETLRAARRMDEAECAYRQAIALDGMDPLARMGLGELNIAAGRGEDAAREFELALLKQPALVAAHLGLGNSLALQGKNEDALVRYRQALALRPRQPETEYAMGFVLARLGRIEEAEVRYRRALTLRPDFAAVWISLGCLLREQGRALWAQAALKRAVELRPDLIAGWINLALLEREQGDPAKAEEHLRKAFALNPDQVETLIAWCQFRVAERDTAGAWGWLRWALARAPENAEAINMHGILLHNEGRFAEAVPVFERAGELGSDSAFSNLGNSLLDLGKMDEALQAHEAAVERDPLHPGARYNLALTRLRLGEWEQGWQDYEARWQFREVHRTPKVFEQPRWRGEALEGRRVLLHAEQGLGDTIQFCRFLTLVTARGGTAVLQVQEPAERLMGSLAAARAGLVATARLGAETPAFDLECPLLSLPAVFRTTIETVPWTGAYLGAEPDEIEKKRLQFPDIESGVRVGFAWAGNPRYKADGLRSVSLATLTPLLRTPGFTWISLQKGEPATQLASLPGDVCVLDGSSQDRDLADTAALLATLDLVITTDTCIAHLAGAMGKPVWILLPHLSDWRWMQERTTTPWYPTARLLRQRAPGDWAELVERAASELGSFPVARRFPVTH